jgi:hypothetical protein
MLPFSNPKVSEPVFSEKVPDVNYRLALKIRGLVVDVRGSDEKDIPSL